MADNQLIYKIVPTLIENGVEFDLQNSQYEQSFIERQTFLITLTVADGVVSLPGASTYATSPTEPSPVFVELIASASIDFRFIALTEFGDFLTNFGPTKYVGANLRGHNFEIQIIDGFLESVDVRWSYYTNI